MEKLPALVSEPDYHDGSEMNVGHTGKYHGGQIVPMTYGLRSSFRNLRPLVLGDDAPQA